MANNDNPRDGEKKIGKVRHSSPTYGIKRGLTGSMGSEASGRTLVERIATEAASQITSNWSREGGPMSDSKDSGGAAVEEQTLPTRPKKRVRFASRDKLEEVKLIKSITSELTKKDLDTIETISNEAISKAKDTIIKRVSSSGKPEERQRRIKTTENFFESVQEILEKELPEDRVGYIRDHFDEEDVNEKPSGLLIRRICHEIANEAIWEKAPTSDKGKGKEQPPEQTGESSMQRLNAAFEYLGTNYRSDNSDNRIDDALRYFAVVQSPGPTQGKSYTGIEPKDINGILLGLRKVKAYFNPKYAARYNVKLENITPEEAKNSLNEALRTIRKISENTKLSSSVRDTMSGYYDSLMGEE